MAPGAAVEVYPTEHSEGVAVCPPLSAAVAAQMGQGGHNRFTRPSIVRAWGRRLPDRV